jgi:hypothetical protein
LLTLPKIVDRAEQRYVAIKSRITMEEIGPTAQNLMPELFLKYNVIDMKRKLEIEFGVPTASPVSGDERVLAGVLPSGRYATLIYRGPYKGSTMPMRLWSIGPTKKASSGTCRKPRKVIGLVVASWSI